MPGAAQGGEVGVGDLAEVTSPAAAARRRTVLMAGRRYQR
jgi:hypothetical protein